MKSKEAHCTELIVGWNEERLHREKQLTFL